MNSHRRCALADMFLSSPPCLNGLTLGSCGAREPTATDPDTADAGRDLSGRHHRRRRRAEGARRVRGSVGAGARGRVPHARCASDIGHRDRLERVGPAVRGTAAGQAAPVRGTRGLPPPCARDAGRPAVPHPRRVHGLLLRARRAHPGRDGRRRHGRRRGARLPVLRATRPARLRRRHREPGWARGRRRRTDRRRGSGFRRRRATSMCRSTPTT